MRLPHPLLESLFFCFTNIEELDRALGDLVSKEEKAEIARIAGLGFPPVTSRLVLATMFGINPGLVWSLSNKTEKYYRSFTIPKGRGVRRIDAPKVALKIIQTWLSVHLQRAFVPFDHVYGFVTGRSHVEAAARHCNARWVFSVDIKNFFPTTPLALVITKLQSKGYNQEGAELLGRPACYRGALAQGAPSSPVLSNICFEEVDRALVELAEKYKLRLTRYADDIVFSGLDKYPENLPQEVATLFTDEPWQLAEQKTHFAELPNRLKVHGMLVHGPIVRLTKGYRNKLRAYQHLIENGQIQKHDLQKIKGHIGYGEFVKNFANIDHL